MKNIHLLSTNKPSRLVKKRITNELKLSSLNNPQLWENVNIYITNDEKIKEGDWVILTTINELVKVEYNLQKQVLGAYNKNHKKIILTTDQELIKNGVQPIDDEFLKWFVENPSCEGVEVIPDVMAPVYYEIVISKEENKIDTCYNFDKETGCVQTDCRCEKEEPKQEILEEAAERLYPENWESIMEGQHDSNSYERTAFINGAKWQKKDCVQFINKLEDESFDGWSEEAISGYLTACMTIKQKYIDTLNGN
jgi:hypothetical protein